MGWPEETRGTAGRDAGGRDWRDTLRNASDLALLGLLTALGMIPVVTAGAAVATASAALHQWIRQDRWPGVRPVLRIFVRALLPGAAATLVAGVATALLAVNLLALARGLVPGGVPLLALTVGLGAVAAGFAGLVVVEVGRQDGQGWRQAALAASRTVLNRPVALLAVTGTLALAAVLCALVLPVITPILAGYVLFAVHAIARRFE